MVALNYQEPEFLFMLIADVFQETQVIMATVFNFITSLVTHAALGRALLDRGAAVDAPRGDARRCG